MFMENNNVTSYCCTEINLIYTYRVMAVDVNDLSRLVTS